MLTKIVLTGGACGGKSSALDYLRYRLPELGLKPFFIPELVTILFNGGIKWKEVDTDPVRAYRFQTRMIRMQISNEKHFEAFAENSLGEHKVLICDRGTIDNLAYIDDQWHQYIFEDLGYKKDDLKKYYDGIIHLDTFAKIGGFDDNNAARHETPEEAINMCNRTYMVWDDSVFRPHIRIPAGTQFNEKLEEVAQTVLSIHHLHGAKL